MNEFAAASAAALWLGVLTSISPCPLATNIAAVSYVGRRVGSARLVLASGLLYAAGRTITYVALGAALSASLLAVPQLSHLLQKYMNILLGPLLVLVGMLLAGLLESPFSGGGGGAGLREKADGLGVWGAWLLGVVFALSFCPTSAALFFGSLLPLAVGIDSPFALPALYGVGTRCPCWVSRRCWRAGRRASAPPSSVSARSSCGRAARPAPSSSSPASG
ncbi:MAG: aromatic aminobenezylarsenical efflux permease ArsG family transporter [Candidatus Sumerlaeia bacterium]|nr:aromatic aminobenezylarsenical efflux permease ArsG family transporter [Candidatus Sumerlaeia bacterium]